MGAHDRGYVPSSPPWRLTTPTRYANLEMPEKPLLIRFVNKLGLGKPESLRSRPIASLSLGKSSHQAQALAAEDLTTYLDDEAKQDVVGHLRDHLPELAAYGNVRFCLNNNYWLVDITTCRFPSWVPMPAFIAGCPVHQVGPRHVVVYPLMEAQTSKRNRNTYALDTEFPVNAREVLVDEDVVMIANAFSKSIGFRLDTSYFPDSTHGFFWILYRNHADLKAELKRLRKEDRLPSHIGGLGYNLKVVEYNFNMPDVFDRKYDAIGALEKQIQAKKVDVRSTDYLFTEDRTTWRRAMVYRSDVDTAQGMPAWQNFDSKRVRKGWFGRRKKSPFNYGGTFVD